MSVLLATIKTLGTVPRETKPDFKGRNIIVTGANVGLGFEAALKFVQLGAGKVILGVRTISKGEEARKLIEERTGRKGVIQVWHLDMLDYATVKAFAGRAKKELDHLDIAVLNAGVAMVTYKESSYGWEQTMQVNVLSTALLALLLMPKLKESKTAAYTPVMEIVGSIAHGFITKLKSDRAPFASYNGAKGYSGPQTQYSVSKLFLMYVQAGLLPFANSEKTGKPDVYVTVVCPGPTKSEIGRDAKAWYFRILLWLLSVLIQRETEVGARTYISGVSQGEKAHGRFWNDDEIKPPAPLLVGERGKKLQATVWKEVVEALKRDVPEVQKLAAA